MPAKRKITREMILDATMEILRAEGYGALNVRHIAAYLKCSTQPIYYVFKNMDELKQEVKAIAAQHHKEYVQKYLCSEEYDSYRAYGMGFVRFATEEQELFRYLYLYDKKGGRDVDDVNLSQILDVMVARYGYTRETAEKLHHDMSFYTYGIAMMMNTGYLRLTEEEISERLRTEFLALTGIYGAPPAMRRAPEK